MATSGVLGLSPAASVLGLGGTYDQTVGAAESPEQRKKRLAALASSQRNITGALGGDYSPAAMSLGLG